MTDAEIKADIARYREHGDLAARERVIRDVLPLVRRQASACRVPEVNAYGPDDAFQDAAVVALAAVEAFDPAMSVPFDHYLSRAIRRRLPRKSSRSRFPVALNEYAANLFGDFRCRRRELARAGRPHGDAAVYEALGWGERMRSRFARLLVLLDRSRWLPTEATGEGGGVLAMDADAGPGPAERAEAADELALLGRLLGTLTPRKAAIVRDRLGIGRAAAASHREIARSIGYSEAHTRSLYNEAIRQLSAAG